MQSVGGSNKTLECADCKTCFTSASLLLKHFAEHIIEQATETELNFSNESGNATTHKKVKLSLLQAKKKERKESILETVLRQSAIQSRVNEKLPQLNSIHNDITSYSNTSSSDSFKSSNSQNCASRSLDLTNCVKVEEVTLSDDMVIEIGQRAKEKHKFSNDVTLVKFDLQKRLENCVSRLALKQGHTFEVSKSSMVNNKQVKAAPLKKNVVQSVNKEVTKKCEGEDFNPLKFCVVTFEDGVEKEDADKIGNPTKEHCISKPLKGASNRKQLMPKKIHRPKEDSASVEVLKTDILSLSDNKICQKPSTKRKYLCHVCSKSFGWSTDLKRHILTHTGERPFKCQMCDATFTRNFLLQKHESRVHSLDNVDNRFTQEEVGESVKSAGINNNNNEMDPAESEKNIILSGRNQQNKVWKNNRLLSDKVKSSLAVNLDESCDKFAPAKRKLQCEESFDHFPQKVFNIL